MDILTREEFHADLQNAIKRGVLKSVKNGNAVVETVYQNYYTGLLLVQVDTTHSDGSVSTHYEEHGEDREIKVFAERLYQQKIEEYDEK